MVRRTSLGRIRREWPYWTVGVSLLATVGLWLLGARYPIAHDAAMYALLSESLWQGSYTIFGQPYDQHLPFHPIVSYPLVWLTSMNLGIKLSTLLAAMGTLAATFLLLRRVIDSRIAAISALLLAVHHGFVYQSFTGYADLLFTLLYLLAVYCYYRAGENTRWYLLAGLCTGLACLTRYNGLPLFVLFLGYTVWQRKTHLRAPLFWLGGAMGAGIFGTLIIRNILVFGNPLQSYYWSEGGDLDNVNLLQTIAQNTLYYLNPLHNILPILLAAAIYGLWRYGQKYSYLVLVMLTAWVFTLPWPVPSIRFALPGYVLLIAFASLGLRDWWNTPRYQNWIRTGLISALIFTHAGALCLYSYGWCNAAADQRFAWIPPYLGLTQEGMHSFDLIRRYINESAVHGAQVLVESPVDTAVWSEGVFRKDLVIHHEIQTCPVYVINQGGTTSGLQFYQTDTEPRLSVARVECSDLEIMYGS